MVREWPRPYTNGNLMQQDRRKAKSKMGRRCEERPQEDGSEQLETKDAGKEEMERNN
jgi:hypothetical protein